MRGNYITGIFKKTQIIQRIYNLMNLSVNSMVIIINNSISAQVMKEKNIKSISISFKTRYDKENSEREKLMMH